MANKIILPPSFSSVDLLKYISSLFKIILCFSLFFAWAYGTISGSAINFVIKKMSDQNQQNQLNIELSEEIAEGIYSNLAIISHSHSEFVLDFIRLMPNVPKAKVKSRIVLTPQHAKRLLKALSDNVSKYENQFGTIQDPEPQIIPPMAFSTPTAQA